MLVPALCRGIASSVVARVSTRIAPLIALSGVVLLGACSRADTPRAAPPSQVAVRVNQQDISSHQVLAVLQNQPQLAAQGEQAPRRVLDALIEQELAAQAAREAGIDKQPRLVQAMELARREVLARAWQDDLAAKATGPSTDEVDRHYAENPALFAQRRLYTLQETLVEAPKARHADVQAIAARARGAEALEAGLSAASLENRSRQFVQAAEDMPAASVKALAALAPGQSFAVPEDLAVRVYTLLHAQPAPVSRRVAGPAIEAWLLNERRRAQVQQGMKALRDAAKIEYPAAAASASRASSAAR